VRDRDDRLLFAAGSSPAEAAYQPAVPGLQPARVRIADQAACTSIGLM